MKISKNLPIYLLSASLLFVGVASISQAQGATSTSSQILTLQKQVNTLKSEVKTLNSESQNTHDFINIIGQKFDDRITTLENNQKPTSIKTATITYAVMGTTSYSSSFNCPSGFQPQALNTFNAPYSSFNATPYAVGLCSIKVLIP